jgi:thioesterase domain-containing protein
VAIRQQGVIRLVNQPNYVDIAPGDTIAQISNAAFDASTFEIWGALINGARLVILSRETVLSPTLFAQALRSHRVTTLFLTTALFNKVSIEQPAAFSTLRNVLFGGEACDAQRVMAVMKAGPPARLVNVYGPTETTTFATYHVVREQEDRATIPIGRPISETQVLLLDGHGQLVPPGVTGEIHIGGLGVAAGYVGRPDETRAHFVEHPFEPDSDARLYRTGDHARWLPDGSIEFLGRHDDQVKIRGFRIETAEVTAALATHPDIRACHVMARPQPNGELGLTAYLVRVPSSAGPLSIPQLRGFLSERLPGYMIPASYVALESLPLTINGKIDVRALPDPAAVGAIEGAEPAGPRDSTEATICRVWAEVLGAKSVGLDDNFFEIGGHSLLAARMFARLDEEFGRPLPLGVLFSAPTVRQLAERFRDPGAHAAEAARALVPLQSHGGRPALYIVPGVFGNVVGYADLVRALGRDQPVYGLQSIGLNGQAAPLHSMQAIAQHHVAEIRAHQPNGPYAIVGVCFGATVAFEVSRQLLAQGQPVAYLGLIAPTSREGQLAQATVSRAPRSIQRSVAFGQLLVGRLRAYALDMRGLDAMGRLRYLANKLRSLAKGAASRNAFKGAARELNQLEVYRANIHALDSYRRLPLVGNLTTLDVFESEATVQRGHRDLIDWRAHWQGPICQHMVPGDDSGDMIGGSNAALIGGKLAERLKAAFDGSAGRRGG